MPPARRPPCVAAARHSTVSVTSADHDGTIMTAIMTDERPATSFDPVSNASDRAGRERTAYRRHDRPARTRAGSPRSTSSGCSQRSACSRPHSVPGCWCGPACGTKISTALLRAGGRHRPPSSDPIGRHRHRDHHRRRAAAGRGRHRTRSLVTLPAGSGAGNWWENLRDVHLTSHSTSLT